MREAGGPTTQSGIYYQNSVAALYLGNLCDSTSQPPGNQVVEVRVEAPEDVDDIVVTFADGHRLYIQAKENIQKSDEAWEKLWIDFKNQFDRNSFRKGNDKFLFHIGEFREEHKVLKGLCQRAISSQTIQEWIARLNQEQNDLLKRIKSLLLQCCTEEKDLLDLMSHVEVTICPVEEIEKERVRSCIPKSNRNQVEVFCLLRDRVGGAARIRDRFDSAKLVKALEQESGVRFVEQPRIEELRELIRNCGASLKQYKNKFGNSGVHLKRQVVDEIIDWVEESSDQENVAILLDQAGMGKTVVARDVLASLEDAGITVLAIKADELSGIESSSDLQARLDLPDRIERILRRFNLSEKIVLLIDQIDALSLSLAHDQAALNTLIKLIASTRYLSNIRIIISCRLFDFNTDPRLKSIETQKKFSLPSLSDEEIKSVLEQFSIDLDALSPEIRVLIRVPLHLDLFIRLIEEKGSEQLPPSQNFLSCNYTINNLQDLYSLLWQNIISKPVSNAPSVADRENALKVITEEMDRRQKISIPQFVIISKNDQSLFNAANWLVSEGILIPQKNHNWTLIHQTFFDYCYAKNFVEGGRNLYETIKNSDQGLFVRPQLIQVLNYLRGSDEATYLKELNRLLSDDSFRFHLKDNLRRWFGAIPNPSESEWLVVRRLFLNDELRPLLLNYMSGNIGWFDWFKEFMANDLETRDDLTLDNETIPFLTSMITVAQADVVNLLSPYVDRNEKWNNRLRSVILRLREYKTKEAVDLYERVIMTIPLSGRLRYAELNDIAELDARAGCRLIRKILDEILESYCAEIAQEDKAIFHALDSSLEILNGSAIVDTLNSLSQNAPEQFLEQVLPWLEQIVELSKPWGTGNAYFSSDKLSDFWDDGPYVVHHEIIKAFITALTKLSQNSIDIFNCFANRLAALPSMTPQRLLIRVYCKVPELYSIDALEFLVQDKRRLNVGEKEQYDTRQLIKAIIPYLTSEQVSKLEAQIMGFWKEFNYRNVNDLRWRGLEELALLQCIPEEKLSENGLRYFRELQRKFPTYRASDDPHLSRGGWVGSPISEQAIEKMSDQAWLRAIGKYKGNVSHKDFLKGGAQQLSVSLEQVIKKDPERFYRLAMQIPLDTDPQYIKAFVNGFAESAAPIEMLINVIRRFAAVSESNFVRSLSRALEKRAEENFPEDICDLLESHIRSSQKSDENWWQREEAHRKQSNGLNDGPYMSYLNSDRGSAFQALMRVLSRSAGDEAKNQRWELIEYAAFDPSVALQAGAIQELLYLLSDDRERTITLFEKIAGSHPALQRSHFALEFIYWVMMSHYNRMRPFIIAAMNDEPEYMQKRGAELACIASLYLKNPADLMNAQQLVSEVKARGAAWRRGIVRIYSANVKYKDIREVCLAELAAFLNDEDEQIQNSISNIFFKNSEEEFLALKDFISTYVSSRAFQKQSHDFFDHLWSFGILDPPWALSIVKTILSTEPDGSSQYYFFGIEQLIRLVLRIYTDPSSDEGMRTKAMDTFDKLMERFAFDAHKVLQEWDRK